MAGFYAEADETQKHIWHIERIWKLAESLEIIEIPIEDIEGMHRIARHLMEGKTTLRVKRFAQDPEPDEIVHFANTLT